MSDDPPCSRLEWDSEFFGFGVAELTRKTVDVETLSSVDTFCKEEDIRVVFYLADSDDLESIHCAEQAGYRLVDDRITLSHDLDVLLELDSDTVEFRSHQNCDVSSLKDIAEDVFQHDRFHADPCFDDEKCDEMRATWTENLCGDLGDRVIVAELDDRIAGYIALKTEDTTGKIVLTGVAPFAQGNGIGSALTSRALRWFDDQGCDSAVVVTQSRNVVAQRLYQELGFRTTNSEFWFHKWFN